MRMARQITRRELFSWKGLRELSLSLGVPEPPKTPPSQMEDYFRSPLHSYPLLQEMPQAMLEEEAARHGIPVKNRSKNDIARELFLLVYQGR